MTCLNKTNPWRLVWTDDLSVGLPEIDAEHKHFILLINELNSAITSRMGIEEIKRRMRAIIDDAVTHFAHEERLFKEWAYPLESEHVQRHSEALQYLQKTSEGFGRSGTDYEWIEAGLKVKQTLIEHLLHEDMKYRDFCRENGRS
jgi:hemerythrin